MTQHPTDPWAGHSTQAQTTYSSWAGGNARVGAQIGVVQGNLRIYQYAGTSPEEGFRVGVNNLRAGAAREAERLIGEAVRQSNPTNEVLFYYVLALVDDRSIDQVIQEHTGSLKSAFTRANPRVRDKYYQALQVIEELIFCLIHQGVDDSGEDSTQVAQAMSRLALLPEDLKQEIHRHLDVIMTGLLNEAFDAQQSREVEQQRMKNHRAHRAIKYFTPDPAPPIRPRVEKVSIPPRIILLAAVVCFGLFLGAFGLLSAVGNSLTAASWLSLAAMLAGIGGIAWGGFGLLRAKAWSSYLRQFGPGPPAALRYPGAEGYNQQAARFARTVDAWYVDAFTVISPDHPEEATRWRRETDQIRTVLRNQTIGTYWDQFGKNPERLFWLAQLHAEKVRRAWQASDKQQHAQGSSGGPTRYLAFIAGLIIVGISGLSLLPHLVTTSGLLTLLMFLVAGLAIIRLLRLDNFESYAPLLYSRLLKEQYDKSSVEEDSVYRQWVEYLRDRPDDLEIAEWLDADTRSIRINALRQYGLSSREILAHLVLTEAAPGCLRARWLGGPARYSDYIVQLFLLTENGVRQLAVELDFTAGILGTERRLNFRYDALASAEVHEVAVRYAGRQRWISPLRGTATPTTEAGSVVFSQSLHLVLVSGSSSDILIENYKLWEHELESEDKARLLRLAMETSGVSTALRILEAVAADGRDWIKNERARSIRTLQRYSQRDTPTAQALPMEHGRPPLPLDYPRIEIRQDGTPPPAGRV